MRNALSVDVEDWFQVGAFENTIARDDWAGLPHRVERNTDAVLELLDDAGVKATFFTLGWVAERYPALIRRIAENGHEVASHGYDHQRVFTFTPFRFRADLRKARDLLENAAGCRVTGYRAPSFSIDTRTPWAHPILAEEGYVYSSSVAPVKHDHYGWPDSPRFAWHPVEGSSLVELPVTTARFMGRTLAAGGGGFFRLFPYAFSRWAVRQVNGDYARPAIIYFHPWEIDPDQPRVEEAPLRSKVRHYTNLRLMAPKLRRLARDFAWGRIDELVEAEAARLTSTPLVEQAA
ncbi:XrtA system polysaccharide deacetylase [Sphingobium phenoxybenzoativorans]|uniref:XrtA system polysaccharide deacetylase n=1 Tax=Sphingobium phenoxybenzoativorans TaxID=1592790 RepID=UPI000871EC04|nr:XrtA system polysaccharide deacetylase [Sphingobium phenoxybenzoativorans]